MKSITGEAEFIIGIDFGSSETSAGFCDLKSDYKKDLDILPGLKVIPSAVAILAQDGKETICIGEAAIQKASYSMEFQIGFRKRPSEMNLSERNRMVAFMHGVYIEILHRHPDFATRPHVVYMAGHTSDLFFEKEEKEYLKMAEYAGLPIAGIVKRHSATIFRAILQPESHVDQLCKNGFLLVDYGANTIDFVYINSSLSKPIYNGCPLGASTIERILLRYAMENPSDSYMPEIAKLYGNDEESYTYQFLLHQFRKAKEQYYGKRLPVFSVSFDYSLLTSMEQNVIYGFGGIGLPREKIDQILGLSNRDGYIGQIKEYARFFKDNILVDNKVECVYLTGGASRMDFVKSIFMEVFNLDEYHCVSDDNPSVITSKGVADLAYARYFCPQVLSEFRFLS